MTLAVGGTTEVVDVRGEAPLIQSTTGERSFTVATDAVANLPIASRNFTEFINLVPGVIEGNRAGDSASTGGGSNNFMMDGVGTMEPGSNRLMVVAQRRVDRGSEGADLEATRPSTAARAVCR